MIRNKKGKQIKVEKNKKRQQNENGKNVIRKVLYMSLYIRNTHSLTSQSEQLAN